MAGLETSFWPFLCMCADVCARSVSLRDSLFYVGKIHTSATFSDHVNFD